MCIKENQIVLSTLHSKYASFKYLVGSRTLLKSKILFYTINYNLSNLFFLMQMQVSRELTVLENGGKKGSFLWFARGETQQMNTFMQYIQSQLVVRGHGDLE